MTSDHIRTQEAVCKLLGWLGRLNVRFILRCWLLMLVVVVSHAFLSLCLSSLCLCQCGLHLVCKLIDCLQMGCWLCRFKTHTNMLAGIQIERCLLSSGVDM